MEFLRRPSISPSTSKQKHDSPRSTGKLRRARFVFLEAAICRLESAAKAKDDRAEENRVIQGDKHPGGDSFVNHGGYLHVRVDPPGREGSPLELLWAFHPDSPQLTRAPEYERRVAGWTPRVLVTPRSKERLKCSHTSLIGFSSSRLRIHRLSPSRLISAWSRLAIPGRSRTGL